MMMMRRLLHIFLLLSIDFFGRRACSARKTFQFRTHMLYFLFLNLMLSEILPQKPRTFFSTKKHPEKREIGK